MLPSGSDFFASTRVLFFTAERVYTVFWSANYFAIILLKSATPNVHTPIEQQWCRTIVISEAEWRSSVAVITGYGRSPHH